MNTEQIFCVSKKNTAADVWLTYVTIHYCLEQLIGLSFANLYTELVKYMTKKPLLLFYAELQDAL